MVTLLDHLDAWRRPDRVLPYILCCKADFQGRKHFTARPFKRADYFMEIFEICQQVKAADFVAQGYKGLEVREQMHLERVRRVDEYLKTLPADELDDSVNGPDPALAALTEGLKAD